MKLLPDRFNSILIGNQQSDEYCSQVRDSLAGNCTQYLSDLLAEVQETADVLDQLVVELGESDEHRSFLTALAKLLSQNIIELKVPGKYWILYLKPAVVVKSIIDSFPFLFSSLPESFDQ